MSLLTEAENKHLNGPTPPDAPPKTTYYPSELDLCVKRQHAQHRQQREGPGHLEWEGVTESLTSATIEVNFGSLELTRLLLCGVKLVSTFVVVCFSFFFAFFFSFFDVVHIIRVALLVKQGTFPA